jgi:hypothetical protein
MKKTFMMIISVLIIAVFALGVLYFFRSGPFSCVDGRGSASYFEKKYLLQAESIDQFDLTQADVIAKDSIDSCNSISVFQLKINDEYKQVSRGEFEDFISNYNSNCSNCLLMERHGWPFFNQIFEVSSNRPVCPAPSQFTDVMECINLTQ